VSARSAAPIRVSTVAKVFMSRLLPTLLLQFLQEVGERSGPTH
jgi:hypothetical protein